MPTLPITDRAIVQAFENDASAYRGNVEGLLRPTSEDTVVEVVGWALANKTSITPAASLTSTTGAPIAERGYAVSLRALDRVLDVDPERGIMSAQPGALLKHVKRAAAEAGMWLPVDPTSENECTIGGAVATNASGPSTLKYGSMARYVRSVRLVTAREQGDIVVIGRRDVTKNAIGPVALGDPVDALVGSEGAFGMFTEIELALLPREPHSMTVIVPYANESRAMEAVPQWVRAFSRPSPLPRVDLRQAEPTGPLRALEWVDAAGVKIMREQPNSLPLLESAAALLVLVIEHDADADPAILLSDRILPFIETTGGVGDAALLLDDDAKVRSWKQQRHAIPSTLIERGGAAAANGGGRVSTDWAVPVDSLDRMIDFARESFERAGIPPDAIVGFGHVGDGNPHFNVVAPDAETWKRASDAAGHQATRALAFGGTISGEHGSGKLKRHLIEFQHPPHTLAMLRALKREFDPQNLLAPGNLLDGGK